MPEIVEKMTRIGNQAVHAAANPFRFSSEFAEDDTATVYYNYRHYEPTTGRWMQRDPIGESSWVNYDGFCVNAPLVKFDILGLDVGCDDVDDFLNVLISDRFDFVPDRKFWEADTLKNKLSELAYDGLALPWWLGYNIYLGASRPTVEINISETWEEILCAKK